MEEKTKEQNENIVEKARKFVEEECKKPAANYGYECYICHFVPMVEHAKNLAANTPDADIEVVELAAWLHDIGSVVKGRKNHHITGAQIAEEKLREWNFNPEKTEKIKHCILSHRGSQNMLKESREAQIIADADALSAFDNISGLFKAAIFNEGLGQMEARASVKEKLTNSWLKLSPDAKKFIEHKYLAAMILLT